METAIHRDDRPVGPRVKLRLLGRDIGWLALGDGGPYLQPAAEPADWQAQRGTPELWRHYALQLPLREAYALGPRADAARLEALAAEDPHLALEGGPLPGGLPAGASVEELANSDGQDGRAAPVHNAAEGASQSQEAKPPSSG
jgi:hypothetical protein